MARWVSCGLLSAVLGIFALGQLPLTSSGDEVSDQVASSIVGGGCFCYQNKPCDGGTSCTGNCYRVGGDCTGRAEYFYNGHICGGNCVNGYANDTGGCGSSSSGS